MSSKLSKRSIAAQVREPAALLGAILSLAVAPAAHAHDADAEAEGARNPIIVEGHRVGDANPNANPNANAPCRIILHPRVSLIRSSNPDASH